MPSCKALPALAVIGELVADMALDSTVQLLATTILSSVSVFSASYKQWIRSNQWMMWLSLFGAMGFMVGCFLLTGPDRIESRSILTVPATALDLLEAEVVSDQSSFPDRFHGTGSIRHLRRRVVL